MVGERSQPVWRYALVAAVLGAVAGLAACSSGGPPDDNPPEVAQCNLGTAANCGACDDVCDGTTPVCAETDSGFACVAECTSGATDCDGRCVDLDTNRGNCGTCGNRCMIEGGTSECVAGACTVGACSAGFEDCNGDPADGCETPLGTAVDCGGCADACGEDDRCVAAQEGGNLTCSACEATQPSATGSATSLQGLCAVSIIGDQLRFSRLSYDFSDDLECNPNAGSLTLGGITASGSVNGKRQPLCKVDASGDTLTFTRLRQSFGDDDPQCTESAGSVQIAGAELSGSATGDTFRGLCGVRILSGQLQFLRLDTFSEDFECTRSAGTISLAAVCADTVGL